eukprot:969140-Pelagomonas_calceolata.AAC.1
MPCVSTRMKHTIFQYRSGTLNNQNHAVRFIRSLALYALSQNVIIWIAPSTSSQVANAPPSVTW